SSSAYAEPMPVQFAATAKLKCNRSNTALRVRLWSRDCGSHGRAFLRREAKADGHEEMSFPASRTNMVQACSAPSRWPDLQEYRPWGRNTEGHSPHSFQALLRGHRGRGF